MDNQHKKIKGYRDLSQEEIDMINEIKETGVELQALIERIDDWNREEADYLIIDADCRRWAAIAKTDLQTGLMALTRAVAKPGFF